MTISINSNADGVSGALQIGGQDALPFNAGGTAENIHDVSATANAGALTVGLNPCMLKFRSTTLTTGTPLTRKINSALSLVIPSGATLGAVTTDAARLILVAIDNAGTVELAVVNITGGNSLSETGVINTTAISAAATANNVFYSTTARTGVAYRVVGAIDAVNTAGAWGSPTLVQGSGGQALAAMRSLGYGQTWQGVTRTSGTTYYNTTGKPILVAAFATRTSVSGNVSIALSIGGRTLVSGMYVSSIGGNNYVNINGVIPPYTYYVVTASGQDSYSVEELR